MSRRMLLEDYSENGLMPVMDGLVCWLDGRDGSGTDTVWKDRSGNGNDASLKNFTFSNSNGWTGSGLKFDRTLTTYCDFNKALISDEFAVEFYGVIHTGVYGSCLISQSVLNPPVGTSFATNRLASLIDVGTKTIQLFKQDNGMSKHCYAVNNVDLSLNNQIHLIYTCDSDKVAKSYVDKINTSKCINFNTTGITKEANTLIGFHSSSLKLNATIYAIRIYNRALTEEEIAQNYYYEQSIERG